MLLCSFHHLLVHEGGFGVEGQAPGKLRFINPAGEPLPLAPPASQPPADPLAALHSQQADLAISADTLGTWRGESMDYSWAIESLLRSDGRADWLG